MDSKLVKAGLLIVLLFAVTVLLAVLAYNKSFEKEKSQPQPEQVEEAETVTETYTEDGLVLSDDLSAWMKDETFFDEEKIGDGKYEVADEKPLTYKVSSIGDALRVVVLDEFGNLITGRRFSVNVAGLGDYNDNDRDGIIFIEDVSPGDYSMKLASIKGYDVPEDPMNINVAAKIEYKAVADISYLIKTEADIDAEAEDTAVKDADEESTGNSGIKKQDGSIFGIDVSKWNHEIDWKKVKDSGVGFAIIRCGYRGSKTGVIVEDPCFRYNVEQAKEAGIDVGIYFYSQAVNEREAVEEASAVMSLIKDYNIVYPVFLDSESAGGSGRADDLDVVERTKAAKAFCETIKSGGYVSGIYASKNWFNNRLDISKLPADNVTWLAQYADKPDYGGQYHIWQYSSAGRISGIEGRVDMNLSYLDVSNKDKKKEAGKAVKENDEDGQNISRDM